jgi:hypothetical protein
MSPGREECVLCRMWQAEGREGNRRGVSSCINQDPGMYDRDAVTSL